MKSIGTIAIACSLACLAAPALAGGPPPGSEPERMIWLEPFSYMQMRKMRERMKKMPAARQTRPPGRPGAGKPSGRSSGRPAGGYSARIIHLRDGAYPPRKPVLHGRKPSLRHRKTIGAVRDVMWLEKPDNEILAIDPRKRRATTTGNYKTAYGGDYRIVAYRDAGVSEGRRTHLYSFYEFMAHGDKPSVRSRSQIERAGYFKDRPEFEITRIYDNHDERYRSRSGNRARLTVSFRGVPLTGEPVTLITSQGWQQTRRTDKNGEAVFTLIKEDFPRGGVDKRQSSLYLARASYLAAEPGELKGRPYDKALHVATMLIRVSPSAFEWESRSAAYLIAMFTIVAAGAVIAVRRRRKRLKPARNGK